MLPFAPHFSPPRWRQAARAALLLLIPLAALPAAAPQQAVAQQCPVVSGYVYWDVNNNGLRGNGEPGIPGSKIELRHAGGALAGSTTTDENGYYQFTTDANQQPALQTVTHTANFPSTVTDWTQNASVPQFNPAAGQLRSVEIRASASITSAIKAESLDSEAATITATVAGTLTITAPNGREVAAAPTVNAGSFDAAPYDGETDFAGPSGHDFGSHTATDANTVTISDPSALAAYVGSGSVNFRGAVVATSRTTGSGNVMNVVNTVAAGEITVTYRYAPPVCLPPGAYTIVQTQQPPTYTDGRETSGNVTPIPGSDKSDQISISLSNGDSPNNNFGELRASLSGYVYVDFNDDGIRDQGEPPIPGTRIRLTGTDSSGASIDKTTTTNNNGYYEFIGLLAGDYVITETQPEGYLDGKDTVGTPGGKTENDRHYDIALPGGYQGVNNNFGELLPPTPTPSATPTSDSTPPPAGTPTPGPTNVLDTTVTPSQTLVAGDRTPSAPGTGTGLLERATSLNGIIAGLAVFAASGWLAFLALGRMRKAEE